MTQFDKQLFWELLIACQRTKSLARASAQLRLSLSSASKLIAAFETQTQLQLLDRTTRPATLTRNFERLVPIAQKLVKANVEAQRIIKRSKVRLREKPYMGALSGSVCRSMSAMTLFLNDFLTTHPLVQGSDSNFSAMKATSASSLAT